MVGRDWDEDWPLERRGRKKAAGHAVARSIAEQVKWCSWPLVYWAGAGSSLAHRLAVLMAQRRPGVYAVRLEWPDPRAHAAPGHDRAALLPVLAEAYPVTQELLASVTGQVLRAGRVGRSLERIVGEVSRWEAAVGQGLNRARSALDAAQHLSGPQALNLEGHCLWVGDESLRPSRALVRTTLAAGTARYPEAWHATAAVLLGQDRALRRPAHPWMAWYQCGRALGNWPVDLITRTGFSIGVSELARWAATWPDCADPAMAMAVFEMLLCGIGGAELAQAMEKLARWLWPLACGAGPLARTQRLMELVRIGLWRLDDQELDAVTTCFEPLTDDARWAFPALVEISAAEPAGRLPGIELLASIGPACLVDVPDSELERRASACARAVLLASAQHIPPGIIELAQSHLPLGLQWLIETDASRLGSFLRWIERVVGNQDVSKVMARYQLSERSGIWYGRAFAILDPAVASRFFDWVAGLPFKADARRALVRWLHGFTLADEQNRIDHRFVSRCLPALIEISRRIDMQAVGAQRWITCAEAVRAWEELRWPDTRRLFRRFIEECARRRSWDPCAPHQQIRTVLRLCCGDIERAIQIASVRLELDFEEAHSVEQAWRSLDQNLQAFISRAAADQRLGGRTIRWLVRAGFCLRLRGGTWRTDIIPLLCPRMPADSEACGQMLTQLETLLAGQRLPGKVLEALERPQRFARELAALQTMEHLPPAAWRRAENLRKWLADARALETWARRDLWLALVEAIDEAALSHLERSAEQIVDQHLRKVIGADGPPKPDRRDWDNAVRLYYSIEKNRKILRRLMIRESRADRAWLAAHPGNAGFLAAMHERGIDIKAWLSPFAHTDCGPWGRWHIAVEEDPLAILQMGNYFGTCLGERGVNAFAAVANAVEANKRVVYVRDDRGVVVGRKLLVMNWAGQIIGFRTYGVGPLDPWSFGSGNAAWMKILLDVFCRNLADRCLAQLHPFPEKSDPDPAADGSLALFSQWYNDGPEPFDRPWLQCGPDQLRKGVASGEALWIVLNLLFDSDAQVRAQGIRALLWLGEDGREVQRAYQDQHHPHWQAHARPAVARESMEQVLAALAELGAT